MESYCDLKKTKMCDGTVCCILTFRVCVVKWDIKTSGHFEAFRATVLFHIKVQPCLLETTFRLEYIFDILFRRKVYLTE